MSVEEKFGRNRILGEGIEVVDLQPTDSGSGR
jgi:hypothetical protein